MIVVPSIMSTATNATTSTAQTTQAGTPLPEPMQSNLKVTHALDKLALDAPFWENDVTSVLIAKNVSLYIEEEHNGTRGDAIAKGILPEIPEAWALEAITKPTAKVMWEWIRAKYTARTNQVLIDQQMEMLDQAVMTSSQTISDHVEVKTKVAAALRKNQQTISDGKLKNAIVSALPVAFESHKANLLGQILGQDTDACI